MGVLAYLRVSKEEQADRRNSLEEQRRRIQEHFEGRLGLKILGWYADEGASAFKDDEKRENFWRMIERAKSDSQVGIIAVDEESRFYRNRYKAAAIKGELLDHGIRVQTVKRDADPRTMAGLWMESIEETMAHAHSLANREYTLRGMAGNVHQRDPKTGWAFKNGGVPPFGWRAVRIDMGRDAKGRPIGRTIWELDEEWAPIRRQILMWRKDGWAYEEIRDALNQHGIEAPRGGLWSTSTIVATCREDMVWTAAGYSIWNKHYKKNKVKGEKFKPVDDWEIEPNGHPAIITEEEAKAIIAVNRRRSTEHSQGDNHARTSPYLLRGNNREDVPIFLCGACGVRVIPWNSGRRGRPKYVCSTKQYKGPDYCASPRIDAKTLDNLVIDVLKNRFTPERIRLVIELVNEQIRRDSETEAKHGRVNLSSAHKRIREIDQQLHRIQRSIMAGFDPELWVDQVRELKAERDRLTQKIENGKADDQPETPPLEPIPIDRIDELVDRVVQRLRSPETHERRQVVLSLVRQVTLAPKQDAVYLELWPDPLALELPTLYVYGISLVPPRGRARITIHLPL